MFAPLGAANYRVEHVATGRVLTAEVRGGEVRMVVAPWDGRDEQRWQAPGGPEHFSG
jgi:hypothetical protein